MFDVFYLNNATGLFPHEQHANSLEHACELSRTRYLWVVNGLNDYSQFDWLWEPVPWEAHQTHVWPSQWQENGGTYLIPKSGIQDVNRSHGVVPRKHAIPRVGIDHGNGLSIDCEYKTRYISDYLGTLTRILSKVDQEYAWVVSSICDYKDFDFTWHPSEWQQQMLHVFPSNEQKFGDTFYVHIPSFLNKVKKLALLEWFDTIHFVENIVVPRIPMPIQHYTDDTIVSAIWDYDFKDPVVQFVRHTPADSCPTINLWRTDMKNVVPLNKDNSTALVPRDAKNTIKTQVYDYPNIDKNFRNTVNSQLQDIIFISYDEPEADANFKILYDRFPRTHRVHGVSGMERALEASAELSSTPWYYAVFAKTAVHETFAFDFVPDYFQEPKHYIFDCKNRVNGLVYGHMGIVLYNCNLILNHRNNNFGLDYTLSFAHESVPLLSAYGNFDTSPYHTWRTTFREVSKLYDIQNKTPTVDTEYRIKVWETKAQGPYAEWALNGARDGREFYLAHKDDYDARKNTFDWQWLRNYFVSKYGEIT